MGADGLTQRVGRSLVVIVVFLVIVGLNIILYTDTRAPQETEANGSRSSHSSRLYGTKALFLLLQDLGYPATQFEQSLSELENQAEIKSLFIIGASRPFTTDELVKLDEWIEAGGHLVIIDREVNWSLGGESIQMSTYTKPNQWQHPRVIQPTPLTAGVERVQLTKFAQGIRVEKAAVTEHIGDQDDSVVVDFNYGRGRVILIGEPYIVANNGIKESDNLILTLNIVRSLPDGLIAFDEYHHGYGLAGQIRTGLLGVAFNLYDYYKRTPVLPILGQIGLLVAAMIYSRSRRFTRSRPLPMRHRTRSLEYVSSMAGLAQRQGLRPLVVQNLSRSLNRRLATTFHQADGHNAPPQIGDPVTLTAEPNTNDRNLLDWVRHIREKTIHLRRIR